MSSFLQKIMDHKREEVAADRKVLPSAELTRLAEAAPRPHAWQKALTAPREGSRIIAEVKQASPSRGVLRPDLDSRSLARCYADAGAAAISVLTDEHFFHGSFARLAAVRRTVDVPLLCKDFIISDYQVKRARAVGADLVLLIAAALSPALLVDLVSAVRCLGMEALIEVHDEQELSSAMEARPRLLGVNNRNLWTFQTDLRTSIRLAPLIPHGIVTVSESGIRTREDVVELERHGFDAFLIGESLVVAEDPAQHLRTLAGTE